MRDNFGSIAHLPMFFMAKIHQFFMHLALFSQNSINTTEIKVGNNKFETRSLSTAVKLASKFFSKMQEHVDDNSIPKDVPAFAKSFFVEAPGGGFVPAPADETKKPSTTQPADGNGGNKRKANGEEQQGQKKTKKEFSDRSLKMGLFHVKKGTSASKALPDKSILKDGVSICLDF
jgi:hypothetical protein